MEKKVEMEMGGRIVHVLQHMVEDAERLGAISTKKVIKNPPKELLKPLKTDSKTDLKSDPLADVIKVTKIESSMVSEIDTVRRELKRRGIKFHPNTGLEKLKAKLNERDKE